LKRRAVKLSCRSSEIKALSSNVAPGVIVDLDDTYAVLLKEAKDKKTTVATVARVLLQEAAEIAAGQAGKK
jgi:hypothetical protein